MWWWLLLWCLTQLTYIFPTNSSIFQCRQTKISTRMCSDFPHDSAVIFRMIPRGRNYIGRNIKCRLVRMTKWLTSGDSPSAVAWLQGYCFSSQYPSSIECVRLHFHPRTSSALYRSVERPRIAAQTICILPRWRSAHCRTGVCVFTCGYLWKTYAACLQKKVSFQCHVPYVNCCRLAIN